MLILKIITSNCSDRDIRQLARCLAGQVVWPARLYGQPAVFTASRLSLIMLNAAVIFRNKLIPKMTKNLINVRLSHMGLVGIWGKWVNKAP